MNNAPDIHPVAALVPEMSKEDFAALKEDIRLNGQIEEITLLDGKILDGRHRYRACCELEMKPRIGANGSIASPVAYVISKNLKRRHLTISQKATIAANAKPMLEKEAKARQHAAGARGKEGGRKKKKTLSAKMREGFAKNVGKSSEQAAKLVGIGARYVDHAVKLKRESPELFKQVNDGSVTLSKAVRQHKREMDRKQAAAAPAPTEITKGTRFACIVIDPPWDVSDEGDVNQMGRANPDYATLPIQEIQKLPVPELSAEDCHLYLWITNRSLPKGFGLLDAWGFRYVTMLTWCKPSIGVGNYFRNNTEHVLFAVRGKLSLLRQDVGTWFQWPRGKRHSEKPVEFYELVESCSPGQRLEMFSRHDRAGWLMWGSNGT